jgi:hypothetical protein
VRFDWLLGLLRNEPHPLLTTGSSDAMSSQLLAALLFRRDECVKHVLG